MKATSRGSRVPATGSALTVAVCAVLGAGPAEATVITIPIDTELGTVNVDFNLDGITDYTFSRNQTSFGFVNGLNTFGNSVAGFNATTPKPGPYASLFGPGVLIDGSLNYISGQSVFLSGVDSTIGPFGQFYGHSGFGGLRFQLPGESGVHYGWFLANDPPGDLTLVEVGFETEQNTGIVTPSLAPEPGTLALLAAGAAGVLAMRRRKHAA